MTGPPLEHELAWQYLQAVHGGHAEEVPEFRRDQAQAICDYWPWSLIEDWAARTTGTWHALFEPTRSRVDSVTVHAFVTEYVGLHATWPSVGTLRRLVGRPGNHRLPGEWPNQEALAI